MIKKLVIGIAVVLCVGVGGVWAGQYWWVGSPQYSLLQLQDAVENKDTDRAFQYIDFDSVFDGIWNDLMDGAREEISQSENMLGGFVGMVGVGIIEGMKPVLKEAVRELVRETIRQEEGSDLERESSGEYDEFLQAFRDGEYVIRREDRTAHVIVDENLRFTMQQHPERYWQITSIEGVEELMDVEEVFQTQ